eukprot:UN08478
MPEMLYDSAIRAVLCSYLKKNFIEQLVKMYPSFACELYNAHRVIIYGNRYFPIRDNKMMYKRRKFNPQIFEDVGKCIASDSKGKSVEIKKNYR